jgi:hypothetical protein
MGAGDVGRRAVRIGDERPETCPSADDVAAFQSHGRKKFVHRVQDVVDIAGLDGNVFRRSVVVGVRGADDDPVAPREDKQNAFAGGDDDGRGHRDTTGVEDQVDPLGQTQPHRTVWQMVGPGTGGIDDGARGERGGHPGQAIGDHGLPQTVGGSSRDQAGIVDHAGAGPGRGAQGVDHEPGIIGQRVKVPDGAAQAFVAQSRQQFPGGVECQHA